MSVDEMISRALRAGLGVSPEQVDDLQVRRLVNGDVELLCRLKPDATEVMVEVVSARACGFCGGEPVLNAGAWLDPDAEPTLPCPRCGEEKS